MFVTNKRVCIPANVLLNGTTVSVVKEFKLLGVTLDDKLTFDKHVAIICRQINIKLFSIKRLFQLATAVKIQFFKTFVLPYFDYCSSLAVYYPSCLVKKLTNYYYTCLSSLFKFCKNNFISNSCLSKRNNFLASYGLFSYQHRLLHRILSFANKIYFSISPLAAPHHQASPLLLKNLLRLKDCRQSTMSMSLRSKANLDASKSNTKYGDLTFGHIFPKLINFFGIGTMNNPPSVFQSSLKRTINQAFEKFQQECLKTDIYIIFSKSFFI